MPTDYNDINLKHLTIFLVEDDVDDQDFLHEALLTIDSSIKLVTFLNGLKFFKFLDETADNKLPDLIILDYNIPEIHGDKILEHLQKIERYRQIPALVWSTSDSEMYRKNCLLKGATGYFVKPSNINSISEMAEKMLAYCKQVW